MAEQFYTILTAVGKAKIANAAALGEKVELTELALGDGGGSYYNPTEDQTELRNEVWRGAIGTVDVDGENPNWITIQTVVPSQHGGFMIREAGVFDNEGDLIAVGKYPETYKPVAADGSIKDLIVRMILEVSNTASVVLRVDPTAILATQQQVDGAEARAKAYTDQEVAEVSQALDAHKAAAAPHSGHETPAGAQAKANTAEANAKAYTDAHEQKAAPHSGHETPAGAQAKAEAAAGAVQAELDAHLADYASKQFGQRPYTNSEEKTYYIDEINGSDENDGLTEATAFKTWEKAKSLIPIILNKKMFIRIIGNLNQDILVPALLGNNAGVIILGHTGIASNHVVKSLRFDCVLSAGTANPMTYGQYLQIEETVRIHGCIMVGISHCLLRNTLTEGHTVGVFTVGANSAVISNCDFGSEIVDTCIYASNGSSVFSKENTGKGKIYGIRALNNSEIGKEGTQPTGADTNEQAVNGSVIR